MSEEIRCPQCGARNSSDADWCTQCFASFAAPEPPPAPPAPAPPAPASAPPTTPAAPDPLDPLEPPVARGAGDQSQAASPEGGQVLRSGDGRFRQTDEGLEWACAVCQEWNPIERVTCMVCSTPFGRSPGDDKVERPDVPAGLLVGGSLVLPGLGHWLLEMRGAGALRAMLALVWGLGGLTLFLQARESGQSFLPAIPLLLGWAVVAAGSANDAFVEGGGAGQKVLTGRSLLWLTLGVVGGTFAAVLVGVLSAVGG